MVIIWSRLFFIYQNFSHIWRRASFRAGQNLSSSLCCDNTHYVVLWN